ncbi:MAG: hypothetical protein U0414_16000 [Polyangiaceae bacterium]
MKPGDHPDFFRFAPPPGTSRESTLRLDAQGRFWHDGELVEPRALELALHRWIARHPDDGRYILTNGYDWCYFHVDATPFFVKSVAGDAAPEAVLSDGSTEALDPATLRLDIDGALIARVKRGAFDARFTTSAQLEVGRWLADDDPPRLVVEGRSYPLAAPPQ